MQGCDCECYGPAWVRREWLGTTTRPLLCLRRAIDLAIDHRLPVSLAGYNLDSDTATVNGKPWVRGAVARKSGSSSAAFASSKAMRVAKSARSLIALGRLGRSHRFTGSQLRDGVTVGHPSAHSLSPMAPDGHARRGPNASRMARIAEAGAGGAGPAASSAAKPHATVHAAQGTPSMPMPATESQRDSARRRCYECLWPILTKNTTAGTMDKGQLNMKAVCKILDRHATHGSPKLELGLLQDLLEELGFTLDHNDIAMIQRQFDAKGTGWVTYKDVVRFVSPGFCMVSQLNAYVLPSVAADGLTVESVTIVVDPITA